MYSMEEPTQFQMLIRQVDDDSLQTMLQQEYQQLIIEQQHLVTMLSQRARMFETENTELREIIHESQRRYEKAVREMQFFKKKHDRLVESYYQDERTSQWTEEGQRTRQSSTTSGSIYSSLSSSTNESHEKKSTFSRHSIYSTPGSGASSVITPVRSSMSSSTYAGSSMIQQRRIDPLTFGGSDALWDTISKSEGADVTVEKIISNFLRRGGSPNTAKQSSSSHAVKYGYGMIHALIVTKAPGSLDLLLQQGANPNTMSMSQIDEDKVSPCYLAASVGWLAGLQKLVQAGGDLISARGGGSKKKTALHVAAEQGHAAVVEYIVSVTEGVLNLETDSLGANVLHYACLSGHMDLVSFVMKACQVPVSEPDSRGELPLHWAVRSGRLEVVSLLVERYGCKINTYVPKRVNTPYDMAKAAGHKKLAEYIKNKGGLTTKKMEKKREEELAKDIPRHLESALAINGL